MSRPSALRLSLAAGATLLVLGAAGCSGEAFSVVPSGGPDWSRGLVVGQASLNNPVPMLVDGEGATLAWVDLDRMVTLARIDRDGQRVRMRQLSPGTPFPHQLSLFETRDGMLHLFWLAAVEGEEGLHHLRLDPSGEPISQPVRLSALGDDLEEVQIVESGRGFEIFWSSRSVSSAGVHHFGTMYDGTLRTPDRLLIRTGSAPVAFGDDGGRIHLAWWAGIAEGQRDLYYAVFDADSITLADPVPVARVAYQDWQRPVGPSVGAEPGWIYLFWSLESVGAGLPSSTVDYQAFPAQAPGTAESQSIWLPRHADPEYLLEPDGTGYRYLAKADIRAFRTSYLGVPQPLGVRASPLVTVQEILVHAGPDIQQQIAMAAFSAGGLRGYEIVSATASASLQPRLALDEEGHLHAAWLDTAGFGSYAVVYATTSPSVVETLDKESLREVVDRVVGTGFNLLLVVLYSPLIATWLAPSLAWLVVYYVLTGEERLGTFRSWLALGLAAGVEIVVMSFLPPTTAGALPWTEYFVPALRRWAAPVPLAALAALPAVGYARRQGRRSIFVAFFIFTGLHGVLRIWLHVLVTL